ncbi:uncharacterized protein [Montipora capricornis]|uniref:uncharacterized protein n=1 Tax=Montipora capricornis TaxID=246305 RepID=UPI0035F1D563
MGLQQYRFTVEYRPGASNPADYASRHPVGNLESHNYEIESEDNISFITRNAVPKAVTFSEVESATATDPVLIAVISAMKSDCWHEAPLGPVCVVYKMEVGSNDEKEGETLLLLVDDYSRFPFVEPVSSTSASAVIPKLDQIFATFGTPKIVRSDNGPPFSGKEFAKFAHALGFSTAR